MGSIKQQRTAERIRQILSQLFLRAMSDPRLLGVTITEVKIDRELRHANIFVGALGEPREEEVMAALVSANGYLRRELGNNLRLRSTPRLHFHWDPSTERAQRINDLLDSIEIPEVTAPSSDDEGSGV